MKTIKAKTLKRQSLFPLVFPGYLDIEDVLKNTKILLVLLTIMRHVSKIANKAIYVLDYNKHQYFCQSNAELMAAVNRFFERHKRL